MDEKKATLPKCFRCVHLHKTGKTVPFTDIPLYKCAMFETEITHDHYALDCNSYYDGSYE